MEQEHFITLNKKKIYIILINLKYGEHKTMDKAIQTYISVLKAEVQHLKTKIGPHDTGHIHTTIGTLTHRIKELEEQHR